MDRTVPTGQHCETGPCSALFSVHYQHYLLLHKQVAGPIKTGPTKPKPFHFSSPKKNKLPDAKQSEKYESMAQKVAHFNATPERFRSRPKSKFFFSPLVNSFKFKKAFRILG